VLALLVETLRAVEPVARELPTALRCTVAGSSRFRLGTGTGSGAGYDRGVRATAADAVVEASDAADRCTVAAGATTPGSATPRPAALRWGAVEPGSTPGGWGRPGSGNPPAADPVNAVSVPVGAGATAGVEPALLDPVGVDVPVRRRSCTAVGEASGAGYATVPGAGRGAGLGAPLIDDSARLSTEMPRSGASSVRAGGEAGDEPSGSSEVVEFSIAR
jgi:hypothetical protein